jgi:copper chaperone CopZ
VRVAIKHVNGVESVNVSLAKGLADVTLSAGNTATLRQLQDAIGKNGFTAKESEITVTGIVVNSGGKLQWKVSGTGETFDLVADGNVRPEELAGKSGVATGTIPEMQKNKPAEFHIKTMELQK